MCVCVCVCVGLTNHAFVNNFMLPVWKRITSPFGGCPGPIQTRLRGVYHRDPSRRPLIFNNEHIHTRRVLWCVLAISTHLWRLQEGPKFRFIKIVGLILQRGLEHCRGGSIINRAATIMKFHLMINCRKNNYEWLLNCVLGIEHRNIWIQIWIRINFPFP